MCTVPPKSLHRASLPNLYVIQTRVPVDGVLRVGQILFSSSSNLNKGKPPVGLRRADRPLRESPPQTDTWLPGQNLIQGLGQLSLLNIPAPDQVRGDIVKPGMKGTGNTGFAPEPILGGAIDLCYYDMGCAQKARKKFNSNPLDELNERQRNIYNELPITFSTAEGLEVAAEYNISERTFKEWLKSNFFRHISHGQYEKRYK